MEKISYKRAHSALRNYQMTMTCDGVISVYDDTRRTSYKWDLSYFNIDEDGWGPACVIMWTTIMASRHPATKYTNSSDYNNNAIFRKEAQ